MTEEQKKAIIESGKNYFRTAIIPSHIKNLKKLRLKDFDILVFEIKYIKQLFTEYKQPALRFGTHTQTQY